MPAALWCGRHLARQRHFLRQGEFDAIARSHVSAQPTSGQGRDTRYQATAAVVAGRQPTPDEVVALVNNATITVDAGRALMADLAQPCLKGSRQATFRVPIAMRIAADTGPAAAMAHLDATVTAGLHRMVWTSTHDTPDGYAIDAPQPSGLPAELTQCTVRASAYLTVTVPAYRRYQFHRVARDLLDQDLQQLCDLGIQVGAARRYKTDDQTETTRCRSTTTTATTATTTRATAATTATTTTATTTTA